MAIDAIRHDTACRLCGSQDIGTVLRLAPTPPEDQFVPRERRSWPQEVYPLDLALCRQCGYVHLPYILNPQISYAEYIYVTKVTLGLSRHYDEYASQVLSFTRSAPGSLVVDLGSNDGTMLEAFKRRGMKVLGVEPAQAIAQAANERGIPTIADFFTAEVADRIVREHGRATAVTANYMYANVDDVVGFTRAVGRLLAPEGVFVVQTGYHPEQMKLRMFDYIYHEHFSYFTVKVLKDLFAKCDLELMDVKTFPAKGGSIRAVAQRRGGGRSVAPAVVAMMRDEAAAGMENAETYSRFGREIDDIRTVVRRHLEAFRAQGKRIVGYGASHSTTTLTYHFDLAPFMEYIVDDNPLKHGLYSPGYHLPVHPSQRLDEDRPDVVVVLAWQYGKAIMDRNQSFVKRAGVFLVPLPTPVVV